MSTALDGVSIVIPLYRSVQHMPSLLVLLKEFQKGRDHDSEVIFVSDGDPDDSYRYIHTEILSGYAEVRIVRLNGNRGQFAATLTGMSLARGKVVLTLDSDCHLNVEQLTSLTNSAEHPGKLVYADIHTPLTERGLLRWTGSRVHGRMVRWSVKGIGQDVAGSSIRAVNHLVNRELMRKIKSPYLLDVTLMNLADKVIFTPFPSSGSRRSSYHTLSLLRLMAGFILAAVMSTLSSREQKVNTDAYICETLTFPMVRDA